MTSTTEWEDKISRGAGVIFPVQYICVTEMMDCRQIFGSDCDEDNIVPIWYEFFS